MGTQALLLDGHIGRLATFGQLALGLGAGAAAEITRRSLRFGKNDESSTADRVVGSSNPFLTPANAERIVQTLCRVRGAALKLGQMLSIQDSDTVPPYLLEIFDRVRHSADFMPMKQVHKQLRKELGDDWRSKFADFDERPFAAASIGQVHKATTLDGRKVAVKIQYPGVAEGIDSDIDNLVTILNVGRLFPKGMFLNNFVTVARRELKAECDYEREARAMIKFRELLGEQEEFFVPGVFRELSTKRVLTTELIEGKPVDKCMEESQDVRNYIASKFIELCLKEIFQWRFMQTDPNWSNFFFGKHPVTGDPRLILLDFGASRSYPKLFVDRYMHIIRAAYDKDDEKMLKYSREIGFLTGYESKLMERAHCDSISILGETLASDEPYDFSQQTVTKRIHKLIPIMLEHRLTSPPEEIYSLHRKLSGSYLLATKLRSTVACGPLFNEIYDNYRFGDDGVYDIDIDTVSEEELRSVPV
uniref:ABC1 domain-containing protein n=1 Tax=Steinernema glaseri TaxID=37863 RepID=A0A1I7YTD8_9BILA